MAPPTYDPYGPYPVPQVALPPPAPLPAPSGYAPVQVVMICNLPYSKELIFSEGLVLDFELRVLFQNLGNFYPAPGISK